MIRFFKYKRIHSQLFISYTILILSIIIILTLWLSIYFNIWIKHSAGESVLQLAQNINTRIDSTIEKMDMATKQVVFSDTISQNFLVPPQKKSMMLELSYRRIISNELYAIIGPHYPSVDQINLINCTNGNYIGAGLYPLETLIAMSEIQNSDLVSSTLLRNGLINIIPPHTDQWSGNSGNTVFCVTRSFKSSINPANQGIVEVPCNISILSDLVNDSIGSNKYVEKLYIFAQDGTPVYCNKKFEKEASSYFSIVSQNSNTQASTLNLNDELLSYCISDYSGWTTLLVANEGKVVNPVTQFRSNILLYMLLSIPLTLLLSYFISKRFTKPIKNIYTEINNLNLSTIKDSDPYHYDSKSNELEGLHISFKRLCKRLEKAIDETATARSYEMESHMLAMESRINPHFLYNTLAMIQAIAEDEKCPSISEICGDMSTLLRYSISKDNKQATIYSEISIASIYLDLLHQRYHDRLSYNINMDPQIAQIKVPRMILQPILENCFKHGFDSSSNWYIEVDGYACDNSWFIKISDNGKGFDENVIRSLYDIFESTSTIHPITNTKLKGVGLANITMRLKLAFGNKARFTIKNNEDNGCTIIIGVQGGLDFGNKEIPSHDC